jgi:CHAT domain-containing protein/lipopolysaccharide biosynthesis regulator YciM
MPAEVSDHKFPDLEKELRSSDDKPQKERTQKQVDTTPLRKMSKPRAPYLTELAMDIDKTLLELASNDPVKAVELYKSTLAQAKKKEDLQGEKAALINLGHIYYLTGQCSRAVENYDQTLAVTRKLKDRREEAVALRNLAAAFTAWGDYRKAEDNNLEALKIFTETGNVAGARMTLNNQGVLEKNRGRYQGALENYERALEVDKEQNRLAALTFKNLGNLSKSWGEYKKAVENFEKSREAAKKIGDSKEEGDALINIGSVYSELGQYDKALESSQNALEIFTRIGAPTDGPKKIVGDIYLDMGKLTEAEPYLKEADYDSSLGRLHLLKSQYEEAKKRYEPLAASSQKAGNLDELFTAYTGLGKAFEGMKNFKQAETYYSKGVDVTEEIRSSLLLSERKNFFAAKVNGFLRSEPGKGLVRVTLKQNKPAQSIYPSEATRAREFADNLSQRADSRNFNVPEEILQREAEVTNKLSSLKTAMSVIPKSVDIARFTDLGNQVKKAESDKTAFVQALSKNHKDYASVKYPRPVKLEESAIGPSEYVVVFDALGDGLGVKVIKGKKVLDAYFTEWKLTDLEEDIRRFRKPFEEVQERKPIGFNAELAATLYTKLLAEPLKQIPAGSPVTIMPDGFLALLPFEVLVTSGRADWKQGEWGDYPTGLTYVGDRNPISYYQSITALTLVRNMGKRGKQQEGLLIVADPVFEMMDLRAQNARPETRMATQQGDRYFRLMAAIEEDSGGCFKLPRLSETGELAKDLEQMYGSSCEVYSGMQSTKSTFMNKVAPELDRFKSIVFATHGFAGNNIPGIMEPVLALTMVPPGTDGFLTMSEVTGLRMNADVVALTACQTGVGVKLAGEGVMSMGRAFQCAGAKSVAMSLWSVSEKSSVMLMQEFFKNLKSGKNKLTGWTEARAAVRKAGFEHPFFWGAFVLVGETN